MYICLFFTCSIKKRVKKGGGSRTLPSTGGTPTRGVDSPGGVRGNTPIDPSEAIGWAVVKYNYQAQQMDELSLVKGTVLTTGSLLHGPNLSSFKGYTF